METFKEKMQQEWNAFRQMTFRKKIDHILEYYRWHLLVVAVVIVIIAVSVSQIRYNQRQQLISGIFVNNATSEEGYAYLRDGYWKYCGGSSRERVELIDSRTIRFDLEPAPQEDAANFMILASMIAAKSLDYIITDAASLPFFDGQEVALDLREILPAETLANLQTFETPTGIIGIGLADTTLAKTYSLYAEDSYILIINNAPNRDAVVRFLDYLLND